MRMIREWFIYVVLISIIIVLSVIKFKNRPVEIVKESPIEKQEVAEEPTPTMVEKKEIAVSIISPEEDTFTPGQARMWSAKIENFEDDIGKFGFCEWKFYLDKNNKETLYKEKTVRTTLSTDGENTCGFTSTFIASRGKLRAEVTVQVKDYQDNILETYKTERMYVVE